MPASFLKPDVLSLLVCDQILIDRLTGKTSLIGMFSTIGAARFPVRHPQLCVFASLTDGRGKTPLELAIVDAEDARPPIVSGTATVEFKDPRAVACLNLHFNGLVFPEPGGYRVQLKCHGELLREARLYLSKIRRLKVGEGPAKPQGPK
ncbi:MAG: hypothetical protein IID34_09760 [Planctomycetes bacterium]|nr:hypothetical protein [Planctomycetota bacterium]